jgi:hypothetical protein
MSAFKIDNWVKAQVTEKDFEVHKVVGLQDIMIGTTHMILVRTNKGGLFYESELEKIIVKFKPFKINEYGQIKEKRHLKSNGHTYLFSAQIFNGTIQADVRSTDKGNAYGLNYCYPDTMEEAKQWLESEYEYIMAKAKVYR